MENKTSKKVTKKVSPIYKGKNYDPDYHKRFQKKRTFKKRTNGSPYQNVYQKFINNPIQQIHNKQKAVSNFVNNIVDKTATEIKKIGVSPTTDHYKQFVKNINNEKTRQYAKRIPIILLALTVIFLKYKETFKFITKIYSGLQDSNVQWKDMSLYERMYAFTVEWMKSITDGKNRIDSVANLIILVTLVVDDLPSILVRNYTDVKDIGIVQLVKKLAGNTVEINKTVKDAIEEGPKKKMNEESIKDFKELKEMLEKNNYLREAALDAELKEIQHNKRKKSSSGSSSFEDRTNMKYAKFTKQSEIRPYHAYKETKKQTKQKQEKYESQRHQRPKKTTGFPIVEVPMRRTASEPVKTGGSSYGSVLKKLEAKLKKKQEQYDLSDKRMDRLSNIIVRDDYSGLGYTKGKTTKKYFTPITRESKRGNWKLYDKEFEKYTKRIKQIKKLTKGMPELEKLVL